MKKELSSPITVIMSKILNDIENYFVYIKDVYGENVFINNDTSLNQIASSINTLAPKPQQSHFAFNSNEKPSMTTKSSDEPKSIKLLGNEAGALFNSGPSWRSSSSLDEFYETIHNCTNCQLGLTRNKFVFGTGNANADIMIIGEAPGAEEDAQGKPFVGRAGQLLTKIIEAINLTRDDVYICNIIKCRPPDNRRPDADEIAQCEPFLLKQIELIQPEFILALGLTAVDSLLKKKHKMADIRGKLIDYYGIKMLVTYHPAALLRNPNFKRPVWEDVQFLRKLYDDYLQNK